MAPKRQKRGRTSQSLVPTPPAANDVFIDATHTGYYSKFLTQNVTESKYLDQSKLRFPVTDDPLRAPPNLLGMPLKSPAAASQPPLFRHLKDV